eukprot:g9465.t1
MTRLRDAEEYLAHRTQRLTQANARALNFSVSPARRLQSRATRRSTDSDATGDSRPASSRPASDVAGAANEEPAELGRATSAPGRAKSYFDYEVQRLHDHGIRQQPGPSSRDHLDRHIEDTPEEEPCCCDPVKRALEKMIKHPIWETFVLLLIILDVLAVFSSEQKSHQFTFNDHDNYKGFDLVLVYDHEKAEATFHNGAPEWVPCYHSQNCNCVCGDEDGAGNVRNRKEEDAGNGKKANSADGDSGKGKPKTSFVEKKHEHVAAENEDEDSTASLILESTGEWGALALNELNEQFLNDDDTVIVGAAARWDASIVILSKIILTFFLFEIVLHIFVHGPKHHFLEAHGHGWTLVGHWIDALVVPTSWIIEFFFDEALHEAGFLIVLRLWRFVRIIVGFFQSVSVVVDENGVLEEMHELLGYIGDYLESRGLVDDFEGYIEKVEEELGRKVKEKSLILETTFATESRRRSRATARKSTFIMREFVEACLYQARVEDAYFSSEQQQQAGSSSSTARAAGGPLSRTSRSTSSCARVSKRVYHRVVRWCEYSLRGLLVELPLYLLENIPHAASLLSIAFLYVFAQCTGMAWAVLLHFASVLTQTLTRCVKESTCLVGGRGAMAAQHAFYATVGAGGSGGAERQEFGFPAAGSIFPTGLTSQLWGGIAPGIGVNTGPNGEFGTQHDPPAGEASRVEMIIIFYVYYAMGRMLIFVVYGLYTIGWESFSDFPTVRRTVSVSMRELSERYTVRVTVSSRSGSRSKSPAASKAGSKTTTGAGVELGEGGSSSRDRGREVYEVSPLDVQMPSGLDEGPVVERIYSSAPEEYPEDTLASGGTKVSVGSSKSSARVVEISSDEDVAAAQEDETAGGTDELRQRRGRSRGNAADPDRRSAHLRGSSRDSDFSPPPPLAGSGGESPLSRNSAVSPSRRGAGKTGGRRALLILPLIWLIFLSSWLAMSCFFYRPTTERLEPEKIPISMAESFLRPTGRMHRCFLFLMLVSFVQWAAQYMFMFPNLYQALLMTPRSTALFGWYFVLSFFGGLRFLSWFFFPLGRQEKSFFGIPHHTLDVILVTTWMVWMMCTMLHLFSHRDAFRLAGFHKERFNDDATWRQHIALFKFTYMVPTLLHFVRGSLFSSSLGIKHAMNDSLIIMVLYPLLLLLIWTATYVLVAAFRRPRYGMMQLAAMVPLWFVARFVCERIALLNSWSSVLLFWAHCVRQTMRLAAPKSKKALATPSGGFSWPPGGFSTANYMATNFPMANYMATNYIPTNYLPTGIFSTGNAGSSMVAVDGDGIQMDSTSPTRLRSQATDFAFRDPERDEVKRTRSVLTGSADNSKDSKEKVGKTVSLPAVPERRRRASLQYVVDGYGKGLLYVSVLYLGTCLFLAVVGELQRIFQLLPMTISLTTSDEEVIPFAANANVGRVKKKTDKFVAVSHVVSHLQIKLLDENSDDVEEQDGVQSPSRSGASAPEQTEKKEPWLQNYLPASWLGSTDEKATGLAEEVAEEQVVGVQESETESAGEQGPSGSDSPSAKAVSTTATGKSPPTEEPGHEFRSRNKDWVVPRYAACGQQYHGLHLLDWALVAESVYFDTPEERQTFLDVAFPAHWYQGKRVNLKPEVRHNAFSSKGSAAFAEIHFPEHNMTVVAIKGTDPMKLLDFLEDLRMWRDAVVVSLLANLFPTIRVWPKATTEMVIRAQHEFLENLGLVESHWAFDELLHKYGGRGPNPGLNRQDATPPPQLELPGDTTAPDRLSAPPAPPPAPTSTTPSQNTPHKTIFVGHSMGGGIASILGFLNHSPVVAFQPPGIYHSIAKFQQVKRDTKNYDFVHHDTLNVIVESDWINYIFDEHGGLLQQIGCDYPSRSMYLSCHLLESVINHLYKSCGEAQAGAAGSSGNNKGKRFAYMEWKYEFVSEETVDMIKKELVAYVTSSTFYSYFLALSSFRYTLAFGLLLLVVRLL